MILTVQQQLSESTNHAYKAAMPFTVAIMTVDEKRRPRFIGSGVFVEHHREIYCITASHVLKEMADGVYIGKNGFIPMSGKAIRSISESRDNFDVAYWKVTPDFPGKIEAGVVLEESILEKRVFSNPFRCVSGFPGSKNKLGKAIRVGEKKITSYCFTFSAALADVDYREYQKHQDIHVALSYTLARNEAGEKVNPPSLAGMSGGPMWFAKDFFTTNKLYLAGILIEYYERRGKVVFCTKIGPILDFIDETSCA